MSFESGRGVRWGWVARRVGPMLALAVALGGVWAAIPWLAHIPRPIARRLTEGILRGLLVGYAGALAAGVVGVAAFGALFARARRRRDRKRAPILARGLLLCASGLVGLAGVEAMSAAWLAWAHRMPGLPTRFPDAPGDVVSIVVIGGSSARGYPFGPRLSVGQIVGWQLGRVVPGRRFAVDVRAREGKTLEDMHRGLAELTRRPDAIVVYSGHNEFQARFEATRDVGFDEAPIDPALGRLYRLSLRSWLCRMIYETLSKHRLGAPPPPVRHRLIDAPAVTPSEYAATLADFRRRLDAIAGYCRQIGAVPILVIPPANDAGFEPNRTVLPGPLAKDERDRLTRAFEAARGLEGPDPARAVASYRALIARQPAFAEAHFRLGRLSERAGDLAAARHHYARARDLDGFPIRCPTPFRDAYRAVAARHGAILIDGPALAAAVSPRGLQDDHGFHDAHHPTLRTQVALAEAILAALKERRALGWPEGTPAPRIDLADCLAHFAIDPDAWQTVCARSAAFYRDLAGARYDPTERRAKQAAYERAGRQIAAGLTPAQTGVIGLDVP